MNFYFRNKCICILVKCVVGYGYFDLVVKIIDSLIEILVFIIKYLYIVLKNNLKKLL